MNPLTRFALSLIAVSMLATTLVSAQASPEPSPVCSTSLLKGTYGALLHGMASGLPFAALDVVIADGQGSLSGTGTIAYNGVVSRGVPISATYVINADCSGSATFSSGATQNLIITRSGAEAQFIRTDNNLDQVLGDAKRTDSFHCSANNLKGDFGASLDGDANSLPFVGLDLVHADGNGNLTGTGTISYNGAITNVTLSATYTVNSDCSGSVAFWSF